MSGRPTIVAPGWITLTVGGVLALSSTVGLVSAQPKAPLSADAVQAARELVAVFSGPLVEEAVTQMTGQVWPSTEASIRAQNPKIDAATLAELRHEFERLMTENYNEVMKDAPAIYANYFSAREMRDLVTFYRSPLGAKALLVMPKAMAEFAAKTQPRTQGLQEKVTLAFLNVLQKRGYYAQ